ncbi:MAG: thiosulfate/3-mercaptopyruvate sulfurtransferase [Candidatus Azotimanducaceae bacterium]|jgi:thiosulfate/3-mercaptopyruvate sulfurtransferase
MALIIEAAEVAATPTAFKIFDCRADLMDKTLGARLFNEGHIEGARFANLETDLASAPGNGGRHPLPDADSLSQQLAVWGVNNQSHVVCVDQNNGAFAARMWWLLRWLGHADVSVLNGGLDAWQQCGFSLSTIESDLSSRVSSQTGNFTRREPLTRVVSASDLQGDHWTITDAREPRRFRGEFEPVDPVAGHIPGAINLPFMENLSVDNQSMESQSKQKRGSGRFKTSAELKKMFDDHGLNNVSDVACYCGSGVTATHNILAMLIAGFDEPALYPGSFSEWICDSNRPVATL